MDLDRLRAFIVVAEELNFRRSAEILGMTQPPLTRAIATLEDELSTRLFERTTRSVKLTGAGVYLLKEARELLARADALKKELRDIAKQKSGSLNIGFSTTSFLASLPRIIEEFRDRFPKVKVHLQQDSRRGLVQGLKDAEFDACFLEGEIPDAQFGRQIVEDETLGVLLPKRHPLTKRKIIDLSDLRAETFILHPRRENQSFFDTIQSLCVQNGFTPQTYIKKQKESCPVLVAIGKGVSLTIPGTQSYALGETRFVPIKDLHLPMSVYWADENPNPSLKTFLSFVTENKALGRKSAECLTDVMRLPPKEL